MWDTFHYYIGSKYFKELSYDRLYECVAVADSEEPGLKRRVELRKIMNLRTNMMVDTKDVMADPIGTCKVHFTAERWADFKHDVAYFRNHHDIKRWEEAQTDHGYNGSPVWNIVGTTLTNMAPISDAPDQLPHQDRSVLHLRDHPHVLVGVRLADHVRRAGGVRHQLPLTLLLDGRLALALGLAVLSGGGRLPGQEGAPAPGGVLPRLFDAAAHLPALHFFGADPGARQAALGQGGRVPLGRDARGRLCRRRAARTPRRAASRRAPGGSRSPGTRGRRSSRGSIAASFRSWPAGRWPSPSWFRSAW